MPSIKPEDTIIGQYTKSSDGQKAGYKDDNSVPNDSRCPTFCAAIAHINNSRWNGVPILLKAGKGHHGPFRLLLYLSLTFTVPLTQSLFPQLSRNPKPKSAFSLNSAPRLSCPPQFLTPSPSACSPTRASTCRSTPICPASALARVPCPWNSTSRTAAACLKAKSRTRTKT